MTSAAAVPTFALASRPEHVFPRLTPEQMDRIAAHGRRRRVDNGEVLLEMGESGRVFVVTAGSAVLSGRRGLSRSRARGAGEVIEVVGEGSAAIALAHKVLKEVQG